MKSVILTEEQRIELTNQLNVSTDRANQRRVVRANALNVLNHVSRVNGHFAVKSQTGSCRVYQVFLGTHSGCTCTDWRKANIRTPAHIPVVDHECKHILAAKLYESEVLS